MQSACRCQGHSVGAAAALPVADFHAGEREVLCLLVLLNITVIKRNRMHFSGVSPQFWHHAKKKPIRWGCVACAFKLVWKGWLCLRLLELQLSTINFNHLTCCALHMNIIAVGQWMYNVCFQEVIMTSRMWLDMAASKHYYYTFNSSTDCAWASESCFECQVSLSYLKGKCQPVFRL